MEEKNNVYAIYNEKRYQLKDGTKTVWNLIEEEERLIDELTYKNITDNDTLKWFRRLGGSEYAERGYTSKGYKIIQLTSKNPDRTIKVVRKFNLNVDLQGNKKW